MKRIQHIASTISLSGFFRYFILGVIIFSGIIVGIETYPKIHKNHLALFHIIDRIIIYIFVAEIIVKLLAEGKKPWKYFTDPWNIFDFIIVAVCFIPSIDTHFVMVLRLARILRVFKIVHMLPKLQLLVNALLKSVPSMGYVVVLLGLIFYIYAVLGNFMFAESDPVHFGDLHMSMITLFKVLTLEGWTDIMNIQLYGTSDPAGEYAGKPVSYASVIYFMSFILIGAMIIMNLFIGVIMNSMQESHNELQATLLKQKIIENNTESIVRELEQKIDGLKTDIKKLHESLKK